MSVTWNSIGISGGSSRGVDGKGVREPSSEENFRHGGRSARGLEGVPPISIVTACRRYCLEDLYLVRAIRPEPNRISKTFQAIMPRKAKSRPILFESNGSPLSGIAARHPIKLNQPMTSIKTRRSFNFSESISSDANRL